ncbi:MAG: type II toxin-antitoxin system VapC family toxin [Candidatus Dormibacteraceae bacterium]
MKNPTAVYLETSTLLWLLNRNGQSAMMADWLAEPNSIFSSQLVQLEMVRVARRLGEVELARVRSRLRRITLLRITPALMHRAACLEPSSLRPSEALHLASAESLHSSLRAFVSEDLRLIGAAVELGLPVWSVSTQGWIPSLAHPLERLKADSTWSS